MATDIVTPETTSSADQWMLPEDRRNLVSETNHEISMLAEGMIRLLRQDRDDDFLIYHGMLARIQQLSELQFLALRLHGNSDEDWDAPDMQGLERVFKGMLPC